MSRNRRNGYEEDTPSFTRGSGSRSRAQNLHNASYSDYDDEDYTGYGDYGYEDYNTGYADDTFSGVYDDSSEDNNSYNEYDDDDYEDYGEIGSNYDTEDDPNWGYDNFDTFDDMEQTRRARKTLNRANDFVNDFQTFSPSEKNDMMNNARRGTNRGDLSKYLEALEKYDRGDINNYEMSKIQRKYANNPFWDTFRPSRDMIKKYGSGNKSTRWPMFKNEGGRWKAEIWRND